MHKKSTACMMLFIMLISSVLPVDHWMPDIAKENAIKVQAYSEDDEDDDDEDDEDGEYEYCMEYTDESGICYYIEEDSGECFVAEVPKDAQGCLELPSAVVVENYEYTVTRICENACQGCDQLTKVVIPNGITRIGSYSFSKCSSLEEVEIPDSVNTIEGGAFSACEKLKTIALPEAVAYIEDCTFQDCSSLQSITFSKSLKGIGMSAFGQCKSLREITIPGTVYAIGLYAFCGCSSLKSLTLKKGIRVIGDSAFCACTSLSKVTIPGSLDSIWESAFYGCKKLSKVVIENGVNAIICQAFMGCSSLKSVTIPKSVKKIDKEAFKNCHKDLVIHGKSLSFAETFATEQGIAFTTGKTVTSPVQETVLKAGKTYSVDLDGDGKKEKVKYKIKYSKFAEGWGDGCSVSINGKQIKKIKAPFHVSDWQPNVVIVDLNKKDKKKEILVRLTSDSGCKEYYEFYHYSKKKKKLIPMLGTQKRIIRTPDRIRSDGKGKFSFYVDHYNEVIGCCYTKWNLTLKKDKIVVNNKSQFQLDQMVYDESRYGVYDKNFMALKKGINAYKTSACKTKLYTIAKGTHLTPLILKYKGKNVYVKVEIQDGSHKGAVVWIKAAKNSTIFKQVPSWG